MVSTLLTIVMILFLFLQGRLFEAFKRIITLFVDIILKILNIFGIHIDKHEKRYRVSKRFKQSYQDISVVKKSKQNEKIKRSINITAAIIFSICLVVLLLNVIEPTKGCVTEWLWTHNPLPNLIQTKANMDVTFIALLFSFMSFSISKLISQWKETRNYRKVRREIRQKNKVFSRVSSKELLDQAKLKDQEQYNKTVEQNKEN